MRHVKDVTIEANNRDHGKTFRLTEMSALAAERWATKAAVLLSKAGTEGIRDGGGMGALTGGKMTDLASLAALQDPSLDSWIDCVTYIHDPRHPPQPIYSGEGCQIEEVSTLTKLRIAVLELHIGFFTQGDQSTSGSPSKETHRTG